MPKNSLILTGQSRKENVMIKAAHTQTRKAFIRSAAFLAAGLAFSLRFTGNAAEKTAEAVADAGKSILDYMKDRISSIYERERNMPRRSSQDNPEIKTIYENFLEYPMSEKAEKLLHRKLEDRSASIKKLSRKGFYPYKRLKSFANSYPFELKKQ